MYTECSISLQQKGMMVNDGNVWVYSTLAPFLPSSCRNLCTSSLWSFMVFPHALKDISEVEQYWVDNS